MAVSKSTAFTVLTVDSHRVRTEGDLVNLNDLYALAGSPPTQDPRRWKETEGFKELLESAAKNLHAAKNAIYKVSKARIDRGGGTWAHKLLAVEYAGYLSPDLKLRINDTFLRVQAGDTSVIEEALDNQSPEQQKRTVARLQGKVVRNHHTEVLQAHGVSGFGFGYCTNATYQPLMGGTAPELRQQRGLAKTANLRDAMSLKEIAAVMLSEVLADEDIEGNRLNGNRPCAKACFDASTRVAGVLAP